MTDIRPIYRAVTLGLTIDVGPRKQVHDTAYDLLLTKRDLCHDSTEMTAADCDGVSYDVFEFTASLSEEHAIALRDLLTTALSHNQPNEVNR